MSQYQCFYRGIPATLRICGACECDLAREGMADCQRCAERRLRRERSALAESRMQAGRFWDGLPQHAALPASRERAEAHRRERVSVSFRIFAYTLIGGGLVCFWGFVWAVCAGALHR